MTATITLIAGGKPGAKVSWQITGIRHDAWANANRSPVEVEKTENEKGLYLHPEAFGAPIEKSVTYHNRAAGKQFLERPKKALYIRGLSLPPIVYGPTVAVKPYAVEEESR